MIAPSARHCSTTGSSATPCCCSRVGPPTWTCRPSTVADTPTAGEEVKSVAGRSWQAAVLGGGHDGAGQRVLGVGLGAGRQGEDLVLVEPAAVWSR